MLAWYGGSPYYLLTGIAVVVSGILIWRRDGRGVLVYVAVLASTTTWAIWEVGFDGWQLLPRLLAPFVLGLALLPPSVRLGGRQSPATRVGGWPAFAGALVLVQGRAPGKLPQSLARITSEDWPAFGNDQGGTRFSPLADLTPENVGRLEKVWEAETGPDTPGPATALEATPIMVGSALYLCDGHNRVLALDAETGRERRRQRGGRGRLRGGREGGARQGRRDLRAARLRLQ